MKTCFLRGLFVLGAMIAFVGSSAFAQEGPPTYALRYLGEASSATADINASGVITGWRLSPSPAQSFVVGVDQPYTLLPLPPGYISSLSSGINDAGVVVGTVYGDGDQKAAAWTPDGAGGYTVEIFPPLPGQSPPHIHSSGLVIGNRGEIIGESINPGYSGGPTVWFNSPNGILDLGPDAPSPPTDVNDNGVLVGGLGRMFYLDTMTSTPIPPGFGAGVFAVNNHEDLAGNYGPTTETTAACRWTETFGWEQLGAAGDQSAGIHASDINDSHVTVGHMLTGSVYFDEYGLFWLNDLLLPEYGNWGLESGSAKINEHGQIALFGWNSGLDLGGVVLLTPIGEMIIPGDVNGDAFVNLDDYCAWQALPIDLDGDGDVDAADEQWLIDRLVGLGFIVADCNSNGAGDHCDIVDGFSTDCDENDMPDECQPDCSGDGLPDVCEADCNTNGVADPCDILSQTSMDCNVNGIPDECDATGGSVEALNVFDLPIDLIADNVFQDDLPVTSEGTITDVDFTLHLDYRIGFLAVHLSHEGTTITILDRPGAPEEGPLGNGQLGYDIVVDDEGTGGFLEDVGNFGSPFDPIVSPPNYQPDQPLSTFDGMPSEGLWTVTVTTYNTSPTHQFFEWGLNITLGTADSSCDCNGNGVQDVDDIANGTSEDCDGNVVPDECEILPNDCNGNGTLDACDVLAGTSPDCNGNATPDECDVFVEDCNGNGQPDDCDVAGGGSADCNNNGHPDECDLVANDCNNNGVVDGCDIAAGTSEDCNWNVVPDECEINPDCNNDDCVDAIVICPGVGTGSTIGATPDGWATCVPVDNADVYYTYTPATSGIATVTTCTSPYDTLLSIHTGCPATSENTIACNDDLCGVNDSQINFDVEANVTYLIRVSGWMWETGDFTLTLHGPECAATCSVDADCDDGNPCTTDTCLADGTCTSSDNTSPCDDGDTCTTNDTCAAGACVGGPPACSGVGCDDCNTNGQADQCDIDAGISVDADGNGVPDECEAAAQCQVTADCADPDGGGARADGCMWWTCVAGQCAGQPVVYADIGGPFGDCAPDGVADSHDRFHALNCFSDVDTSGDPGYACEGAPPAAYNVDAGGPFGSCVPDGVCDGNDAFHALNAFDDTASCTCPLDGGGGGPAPGFDGGREIRETVSLALRPDARRVSAGEFVTVEVYFDEPLRDLRGYQLHVGVAGGDRGRLELVDIAIHHRKDQVFAGLASWSAFNVHSAQLVAGLDGSGVPTAAGGYLATLTFQASPQATGVFVIDLLHDDTDPAQRTFIFPTPANGQIGIDATTPAIVEVLGDRPVKRRAARRSR